MGAGGGLPSEWLVLPLSQVEVPPEESADAITIASVATVSFGPVDLLLKSTHGEPLVEVQSDVADLLSKSNLMATTRGHSPLAEQTREIGFRALN